MKMGFCSRAKIRRQRLQAYGFHRSDHKLPARVRSISLQSAKKQIHCYYKQHRQFEKWAAISTPKKPRRGQEDQHVLKKKTQIHNKHENMVC